VKLEELLRSVGEYNPTAASVLDTHALSATVTSVASDSRRVSPGAIFVALRGLQSDGTSFAQDAVVRGACAVVAEADAPAGMPVPWIRVNDARGALAALAAEFWRHPSEALTLVGITGTNGKTTTSYVLASIFEAAGVRCGRIGTVGYRIGDREIEAARTTPEAPELQHMLRDMVSQRCGACVMEVSSHALALKRADHLRFSAGIFTNLTRDHLDFHQDMEAYFQAKLRLFELLPPNGIGVANVDDRRGAAFAAAARRPVTYAIDCPSTGSSFRRARLEAPCMCDRAWSAGPMPTTSSPLLRLRWPWMCRLGRSSTESGTCRAFRDGFNLSLARPMTFVSSSITPTPTTR
jgi:UDP-N-acetylmuramoyl-L-alanyl-D-glutamate--2,6-diaminopimelate ligase